MQKKVSILIRSMDRWTLPRALDSAAAQTHPDIELVVVSACGNSHRELPTLWGNRPLHFVRGTARLDRASAANAAIGAAAGEWMNFLDDDDELMPEHVETLLDVDTNALATRLVHSRSRVVNATGGEETFGARHEHLDLLMRSQFCVHSAIFHRSLLDSGARFDATLPMHEDLDFWIQCAQQTAFHFVDRFTNRWHAFIGTSGAGGGGNFDSQATTSAQRRLQSKWIHLVPGWAAGLDVHQVIERGNKALRAGHIVLALALLENALARAPADVNALNLAGMANLRSGNAARAVELFTRSNEIYPNHPGLTRNLELARQALAPPAAFDRTPNGPADEGDR